MSFNSQGNSASSGAFDVLKNQSIPVESGVESKILDADGDTYVDTEEPDGTDGDTIHFVASDTPEMAINATTRISVTAGTVTNPAVNFGVAGATPGATPDTIVNPPDGDVNTGIYQPAGGHTIAISAGGESKVTVLASTAPLPLPTGMIEGLNVGTHLDICGINRLSASTDTCWEDGHLGNAKYLYFSYDSFTRQTNVGGPQIFGTDFMYGCDNTFQDNPVVAYPDPMNPMVVYSTSSFQDRFFVAKKLIPKGFRIRASASREFELYAMGDHETLGPNNPDFSGCTVALYETNINEFETPVSNQNSLTSPLSMGGRRRCKHMQ